MKAKQGHKYHKKLQKHPQTPTRACCKLCNDCNYHSCCVFGGGRDSRKEGLGGIKSEDKTGAAFRLLYTVNFAHRERKYTSTATMTAVLKMLCVLLFAVFASADVMPMTDFDLEKVKTQI